MTEQQYTKRIRTAGAVSLWTSVGLVIATALFYFASRYRFYANDYTARWMLIASSVLAVLAVSMALLTIRKQVPQLRQTDNLEQKLKGYATLTANVGYSLLFVVVVLCAVIVFTNQNVLFMLAIVVVMMLFLTYPNIYRIKHDLGLDDEQMTTLFGNKYIASNDDNAQQ
ncbi:MAG: hypothetical protein IJ789_08485 [Bacteroidales bacterium]|nr:hypothetical protein [Bacteroidales bacterium]